MKRSEPLTVFFHPKQLEHRPLYEWAFGEKIAHPETTTRAQKILDAIAAEPGGFSLRPPKLLPSRVLSKVHDARLLDVYRAASRLDPSVTFCPSVFPKRQQTKPDPRDIHQAGYFCFDSGTPLTSATAEAATWSAACAYAAAETVVKGEVEVAYALSRPPGHHASSDLFGGYCYFNNAAIAAHRLRRRGGRIAILDIDFHHGNGTQSIFYREKSVFFASIHGDPRSFYPYFSGWAKERGAGPGKGYTLNVPIPAGCDGQEYLRVLDRVLGEIRSYRPAALVLSAGFDTYREDPIGRFALETSDFHEIGARIGRLELPTVIVQEGGYCTDALGTNVVALLRGAASR